MAERIRQSWKFVNDFLSDEYREVVIDLALRQLNAPKTQAARSAATALKGMPVKGFRSLGHIKDRSIARAQLLRLMTKEHPAEITPAVIALWADAVPEVIRELQEIAEKQGMYFKAAWPADDFGLGVYLDELVEQLRQIAEELAAAATGIRADHFRLAAIWLGQGAIAEPEPVIKEAVTSEVTAIEIQPTDGLSTPVEIPVAPLPVPPVDVASIRTNVTVPATVQPRRGGGVGPLTPAITEPESFIAPVESTSAFSAVEQVVSALRQDWTFADMKLEIQNRLPGVEAHRQQVLMAARDVVEAIDTYDLPQVETKIELMRPGYEAWRASHRQLSEIVEYALTRLIVELKTRTDLEPDLGATDLLAQLPDSGKLTATAEDVCEAIARLLSYDRAKQEIVIDLARAHTRLIELKTELATWGSTEVLDTVPALALDDVQEQTLNQLRMQLAQILDRTRQLTEQQAQLRATSQAHIDTLVTRLLEAGLPADTMIAPNLLVGQISAINTASWTDQQLIAIEKTLAERLTLELAQAQASAAAVLADQLRLEWSEDTLLGLLGRLALDRREPELVLTLISATSAHQSTGMLSLPSHVVRGLIAGLDQFSKRARPFEWINWLAPELQAGWAPADASARAVWYLVLLGASYGSDMPLPQGYLWQLPEPDWPYSDMPQWQMIWEATLNNEPLPAIASGQKIQIAQKEALGELVKARSRVEQTFTREGGKFLRLNAIRSDRHRKMFSTLIFPALLQHVSVLQNVEAELAKPPRGDLRGPLAHLAKAGHEALAALDEAEIQELYDDSIREEKIIDDDPFHHRTAIKLLNECADEIRHYRQTLLDYWHIKTQPMPDLTQETLEAELALHPELVAVGQSVLRQLLDIGTHPASERNETQASAQAIQHLVAQLLSQATYALRLPRTVGWLTSESLDWSRLLIQLLDDLAEPERPDTAAEMLLRAEAPDQVLLLAAHVSVDYQKRAQLVRAQLERMVSELQADCIKAGGQVDDLSSERALGRWRYVRREMQQRLADLQAAATAEQRFIDEQALQLRRRLNDLDELMFQNKAVMPAEVYHRVEQGFTLARRALGNSALFDEVRAYLQEIAYRIEHQSWPSLTKMQEMVDRLESVLSGAAPESPIVLTADRALQLLEQEDWMALGLTASRLDTSEAATRCELLRNWQRVRNLPSFLSEDLTFADRNAIQAMFRYFARMMALKRVASPATGEWLEFEEPAVYAYYELRYPKTDVLRAHCIMLALPGNPPRSADIAHLINLIEEKTWLNDSLVLVFVPGCTPGIVKRLSSRRLVVIDESTMLEWILAETKYLNPLSRLRPRLLNSIGAANVEVFKINQLVNSQTGIFVGRERDVERIANSDGNFAIYGGRRIGKSSLLKTVEDYLRERKIQTHWLSFEGQADLSDDACAVRLAQQVFGPATTVKGIDDLKLEFQSTLSTHPDLNVVLFIDEIDKYIVYNPARHVFVEALRSLSDQHPGRFRTIVSGFTALYDCLKGRGPYTPTSDPWRRMFNVLGGPLGNLSSESAERIVSEGFVEVLGWTFEKRAVPQLIVERTGSHPAFIQRFCLSLQQRVAQRHDYCVKIDDIEAVFSDDHSEYSFIAYVHETLKDNLDAISRYLILWLAREAQQQRSFTWDEAREMTSLLKKEVPQSLFERSLERLKVTNVVRERSVHVFEFSVPDYPLILNRLGETLADFNRLEAEIAELVERGHEH